MKTGSFTIHRVRLAPSKKWIVSKKGYTVRWRRNGCRGASRYVPINRGWALHCASGGTLAELKEGAREELAFLWTHYACGNPKDMTRDAQELGARMRKLFRRADERASVEGRTAGAGQAE